MPYITQEARKALDTGDVPAEVAGELNYLITQLVYDYIKRNGKSYSVLNEVVGVLECAKLELYRRVIVPYENSKLSLNGDAYT